MLWIIGFIKNILFIALLIVAIAVLLLCALYSLFRYIVLAIARKFRLAFTPQ